MLYFYLFGYVISITLIAVGAIKKKFLIWSFGLLLTVIMSCLIGIETGITIGEKNVLSGKPTYKMIINKHIDNGVETCDTTYVKK